MPVFLVELYGFDLLHGGIIRGAQARPANRKAGNLHPPVWASPLKGTLKGCSMIEPELPRPLLWNPLPRAAAWLSKRTGRPFDVPVLLDLLYQDARGPLVARQTVVKAPIPRGVHLAVVAMYGHPERDSLTEGFNHQHMAAEFGALPRGLAYVRHESLDVVPLHANQLSELTLHGRCELSYLGHPTIGNHVEHEGVWIMPFARAAHAVTPEVCGINGHDLYCLGELLSPNPPQIEPPPAPAAQESPPAPAAQEPPLAPAAQVPAGRTKETAEQRQNRRYQMCIDAGLKLPDNDYARLPSGISDVAAQEGITRQAFSEDVKAHINRMRGR